MCRIVEEIVEKEVAAAKAEGEANAKRDSAVRMLKKKRYSIKEIADILDIDSKSVEEMSKHIAD